MWRREPGGIRGLKDDWGQGKRLIQELEAIVTSNPVLIREFVTSLRTFRALAGVVGFLVLLTGLIVLMWPTHGIYSMAAASSQKLFSTMSFAFLAVICLCAPAFTAVAITHEHERNTYDQLHYTLLRPSQIIVGKLAAGVGYLMLLILSTLPMMGACYMLGGVGGGQILKVYAVVIAAGVFLGLCGLLCSTYARSSYRALLGCYGLILSITGVTWIPSIVLGLWAQKVHAIHLVRGFSPFAALVAIVRPQQFDGEHLVSPEAFGTFCDSMWPFLGLAGVGSVVIFAFIYRRIMRPPQPRQRGNTAIIENRSELMKRRLKFPFFLFDPRKRKRMIGRIMNLIFVKEMRSKAFGRSQWVIRCMYIALFVSLALAFLPLTQVAQIGIETITITCVALPLGAIVLITPVITATAVTEEREKNVFDMLRTTLISAWDIVSGKLQMAWFFLVLLIISMLPTFFVLAYVSAEPGDMQHLSKGINLMRPFRFKFAEGWESLRQVDYYFMADMGAAFAVVVLAMIFASCIGMLSSALSRRSSTAAGVAYGVTILWTVGTFIPYLVAYKLPDVVVSFALTLNPFVAAANAVAADTFPRLSADLWMQHLLLVGSGVVLLVFLSNLRVWWLMQPDKK